jgi:uncharacterized membrane protein YvlD (DUF360 family)
MSLPFRLTLRFVLTCVLVWALKTYLPQYVTVEGGITAIIIVGALLTLLNIIVRPVLDILTLPLKLFANILAFILINGAFLWLMLRLASSLDPAMVRFAIQDGIMSWIVLMFILGCSNWVMKKLS